MPFVRFSRDRRGYEHTYLIHAAPRRGAPTRILYWYRTPPGIKVGREAFDLEARRMLEAQYPSVPFDWPKLLETAMPPPDAENWRERRRVERSVRQARQLDEPEDAAVEPIEVPEPPRSQPVPEPAVDGPPVAVDAAEIDSPETEGASTKRRRRGGRRRRRQASPIESGRPAHHSSGPDADSPPNLSTSGFAAASPETPSSPPAPESTAEMTTKALD